jgi:beta-phosphoglucomutase-like phosphatase (HAD superfamily)
VRLPLPATDEIGKGRENTQAAERASKGKRALTGDGEPSRSLAIVNISAKKAVIFDMDGLLLDSERPVRDAWRMAMKELELPWVEPAYLEMIGRDGRDSRAICLKHFGESFPYDGICTRVRVILDESLGSDGYDLKAGVIELLDYLAARMVPCAVATSTLGSRARRRLEQAGIARYLSALSGGDEVSQGKPAPDLFLLTAKKLEVSPENCIVLEDSPSGAVAANVAGMAVVLVPDLKPPPEEVRRFALAVLPSLREIQPVIEAWLG